MYCVLSEEKFIFFSISATTLPLFVPWIKLHPLRPIKHGVWKSQKKFLKTWSMWSNSVARQVNLKIVENAKIEKFKWDILTNFLTMWQSEGFGLLLGTLDNVRLEYKRQNGSRKELVQTGLLGSGNCHRQQNKLIASPFFVFTICFKREKSSHASKSLYLRFAIFLFIFFFNKGFSRFSSI